MRSDSRLFASAWASSTATGGSSPTRTRDSFSSTVRSASPFDSRSTSTFSRAPTTFQYASITSSTKLARLAVYWYTAASAVCSAMRTTR